MVVVNRDGPREQALLLGPRRSLVGVLTPPVEGAPARDRAVVILNSGIIHRVGANRLHVELARDLARAGFRVLRFDLSGIGDSPARTDPGESILDSVMQDIRDAVDHVAGKDGRVVIFGLCSGAAHGLLYAPRDERIAGLVLIDLWIPHTRKYHVVRTWRRVSARQGWLNLITGRHPMVRRLAQIVRDQLGLASNGELAASGRADAPPRAPNDLESGIDSEAGASTTEAEVRTLWQNALRALIARRLPVLGVFTAGLENQHNYANQLFDAFDDLKFGEEFRVEWFPDSDHTFSSPERRGRLRSMVVSWMSNAPANANADLTTPRGDRARSLIASLWLAVAAGASSTLTALLTRLR